MAGRKGGVEGGRDEGEMKEHPYAHTYTVVSCKYAPPPFATLALVQNAGGAYTRDATFSLTITPSFDREKFSGSVDTGFVLALPFEAERCY